MTHESDDPLFLTVNEILTLHEDQLRLFGGASGIRDRNALESAVMTPASTYDGAFLHDDLFHMAAAYAYHIAENQPFVDGNKRTRSTRRWCFWTSTVGSCPTPTCISSKQ